MGKLKDAKMDLGAPPDEAAKKFARRRQGGHWPRSPTTPATQTLEVRKDKDNNYYAKSSAVEGVYKVAADLGDALNKGLDDFRNKKLFDFGFSDPTKIELKNGAGAPYLHQERRQVDGRLQDHGQLQRAEPDRQAARPDRHQVRRQGRRATRFSKAP